MKRFGALAGVAGALVLAGIVAGVWYLWSAFAPRNRMMMTTGSGLNAGTRPSCSPEQIDAGVQTAMAGAQSGAAAGGAGAAAAAAPALAAFAAGPCGGKIEKKLKELARLGDKRARQALHQFDAARLTAQGRGWDIATAGPVRRAVMTAAAKVRSKTNQRARQSVKRARKVVGL